VLLFSQANHNNNKGSLRELTAHCQYKYNRQGESKRAREQMSFTELSTTATNWRKFALAIKRAARELKLNEDQMLFKKYAGSNIKNLQRASFH